MDKATTGASAVKPTEEIKPNEEAKMEDGGPAFPTPETKNGQVIPESWPPYYFKGMTLRDYACIHLKVPDTGKDWLDKIITKSLRTELAGKYLTGVATGRDKGAENFVAVMVTEMADILLEKLR